VVSNSDNWLTLFIVTFIVRSETSMGTVSATAGFLSPEPHGPAPIFTVEIERNGCLQLAVPFF
jgi:hypothetical protein